MVIKVKRIEKIINNKVFKGIAIGLKAITSTLIIIVISIIFIQRVSDNKVTLFGYSMFTIVSESMVPKYEIRDMVIAKKVVAEDIKIGDDVVYLGEESNLNGKIVTHQVIKKEYKNGKYIFQTKGLANEVEDPEIEYDQILGKVLKKSNLLSLLSHVVNNAYGFYFIIFVPFAILLFFEINDIMKEKKLIKEAKEKRLIKEDKEKKEDTKEKKLLCDDEPIPKKK